MPMVLCLSATAQVSWVSFAKSQFRVLAATSAFEASQPDSNKSNLVEVVRANALQRLNLSPSVIFETQNDLARVELLVEGWKLPGLSLISAPTLVVSGYAVTEN